MNTPMRGGTAEDAGPSGKAAGRRVKERRFSPYMFIWTFSLLCVLAGGQALILGSYAKLPSFPPMFIAGMTGYWAIVAGTLSLITFLQIRKRLEPMRKFSEASKQVASGDFSVYLEPEHLPESPQWDSNDEMFEDFNAMVHELGSIETMKNDFVANVSHEIKTPLAIIQSYVQLLGKPDLSDEQRSRYAGAVTDASERLGQFVTNVLKLSKLENQRIGLQIESCDLPRQLADAVLAFGDLFDSKGVELDVDMEDRALVRADPGVLEVVWSNILGNALKFTDPGGHVSLRQSSDDDIVSVEIRDDGCGMSAEELAHVFDKFYQGDTSHAARGNGLGMAMVRRAVELSGGTVTLSSVVDEGTVVLVRLPAAA